MSWSEIFTKHNMPTIEQVGVYVNSPLWDKLNCVLIEDFGARPKLEYSGCSMPGWNVKYKKKGKSLCTIYPNTNGFQVLVIANERNQVEIDFFIETCCEQIRELYRNTNYLNGGKWLFVEVDNTSTLEDIIKLIEFRAK